jgi:CubicO group peptidase (beta-lactamase class C family)
MRYLPLALMLTLSPALAQLRPGDPASVGMSRSRLDRTSEMLQAETRAGRVTAASILVARRGTIVLHQGFGRLSSQPGAPAVEADSIYQVASITKPVTATALMRLVERGKLTLTEPVANYLPEFSGGERGQVRVIDLLKHTSGLPDMLPENVELRRAHAPLSEFVKHACQTPLLFSPGSAFLYQSMGILLAAEIVERLAGMPLPEFEQREIFEPLGMKTSVLGLGRLRIADTVQMQDAGDSDPKDRASWGGNSDYWRNMGHPWGGMHTTTTDLGVLLQTFLNGGTYAGKRILSPVTVTAMTTDQNGSLNAPWGLGWGLGRSTAWSKFGDLVSPRTFGHSGASGTVAWADPETQLVCVILTSRPSAIDNGRLLRLVSNTVAAAIDQ